MGFLCRDLQKTYQGRNGAVCALEGVTVEVRREEFVCVVGPSGCGKSTLLRLIAGLERPTSGSIVFHSPAPGRTPTAAMVFQEHGLFPWMTVLANVAFGLEMRGVPRRERNDRAAAFIELVGLTKFTHSYPHELSVGMRQRVGIARAFLMDPAVLLMDEPLGALDAQTKLVLQSELLRIWRDHRKLVVYVTHDIDEAILLGDRILVMSGHPGRIREEIAVPLGRPREVDCRERPEAAAIRHRIWALLEDEVRASLGVGP